MVRFEQPIVEHSLVVLTLSCTENLAAGTGSSYGIYPAVKSWTDEVCTSLIIYATSQYLTVPTAQYNPNSPQPSHFTQVVWKGSTQVGCAVQSCRGIFPDNFGPAKYFVCEYFPQGNIIGQFECVMPCLASIPLRVSRLTPPYSENVFV